MIKITFQIEGGNPVVIEANAGDNLLDLARRANVAIDAPCSGNGSCGKCRVKLVSGEVDSAPSRHIPPEEYQAGWRLACGCRVTQDAEIFVPDIASAYQSRMKTADLSSPEEVALFTAIEQDVQAAGIAFATGCCALDIALAEPTLDDTMPDDERLTWAVEEAAGVEDVQIPAPVMVKLAHTLRGKRLPCLRQGLQNRCKLPDPGHYRAGRPGHLRRRHRHRHHYRFCGDCPDALRQNRGQGIQRQRPDPLWRGRNQPDH